MVDESRRKLFALGGIFGLGTLAPVTGPSLDPAMWGIHVTLVKVYPDQWSVAVPKRWHPGEPPELEFIDLDEYVKRLDAAVSEGA